MNIQALKYEIIEWIAKTQNNALLKALKSIKDADATAVDWYDELGKEELESINSGIDNHQRDEVLTSKEFWSEYED